MLPFVSGCLFAQTYNTINWQVTPLKIDGKITDWKSRPPYFDSKTQLAFDIRNDSSNLYIMVKIPDPMTQLKIARGGINLDLTTKIKTARKASMVFLPFLNNKYEKPDGKPVEEKQTPLLKQKYMLMPTDVEVWGFAFTKGLLESNIIINTIVYAIDWDSTGIMSIEIKIPLRELFGNNYNLQKVAEKQIVLRLKENGIENPKLENAASAADMDHSRETRGMARNNGGLYGEGGNRIGGPVGLGGSQNDQGQIIEPSWMYETQSIRQSFLLNTKSK